MSEQDVKVEKTVNDNSLSEQELNYKIIGTGSTGNCVLIENVMVDCGLPYIRIKDALYETDILLLTHKHTDHILKSTFEKIRREFPNIIVIANYEVAYLYDVDIICNENLPVEVEDYTFTPFRGEHGDTLCYGYTWEVKGLDIIYATDMSDFHNAPDKKYDYLFLESNHDKLKLNAVKSSYKAKKTYGYDVYTSSLRHCSTQKCKGFYFSHRRDKSSPLIELHMSSRFY